ncbi:MAG: MBL fold metallo-hydrolase, partial [Myxococcota bacterium]
MRRVLIGFAVVVALGALTLVGVWLSARKNLGSAPDAQRVELLKESPQWRGGRFTNRLPRVDRGLGTAAVEFFLGSDAPRMPKEPLETQELHRKDFAERAPLRMTWLGHSSMILDVDGARFLIDPVWGERASPLSFAGPLRFYPSPLPMAELPDVDAVVISHDHYDHLDFPTVRQLAHLDVQWLVPLGVGSHLEYWGVDSKRITELDWWDEYTVRGVQAVCTPSRHFSGRSIGGQNSTLWAGWAFVGPSHRAFFSGDTALHPEFAEIGQRFGPFDLTMFEVGAYNQAWADVHLGPEQAVLAHQLVRGKLMVPVHWGLFDLALHGWTEPVERLKRAAETLNVSLAIPRPGGSVTPESGAFSSDFWPSDLPWKTAAQAPAWSSAVVDLQKPLRA